MYSDIAKNWWSYDLNPGLQIHNSPLLIVDSTCFTKCKQKNYNFI